MDDKMDIVVCNGGGNNIIVYLGDGDGTFGRNKKYSSNGLLLPSVIAVDLNNDSLNDLAVTNQNSNSVSVILSKCP